MTRLIVLIFLLSEVILLNAIIQTWDEFFKSASELKEEDYRRFLLQEGAISNIMSDASFEAETDILSEGLICWLCTNCESSMDIVESSAICTECYVCLLIIELLKSLQMK